MRLAAVVLFFCSAIAIVSRAQTFTKLADFNGANGANPSASVIQGTDGNFYGTTLHGGSYNQGTVFKMTPEGILTTLYSFCSQLNCADGAYPYAGLVQATDGNFYGTTEYGGGCQEEQNGCGTIFKITPSGLLSTMHTFDYPNGAFPEGGLVQATDGNFYGTTGFGGTMGGLGTVFRMTMSGGFTVLHMFDGSDGAAPYATLVQATDGALYGTTFTEGPNDTGTLFRITLGGVLTTLHSFGYSEGADPLGALVQGRDGNFYGTTDSGGANSYGTAFKMTPEGTLITLYSFCSQPGCPDGTNPFGGLVQAPDGNFYGTTAYPVGGGHNGTVFRITPDGAFTTVYTFIDYAGGSSPWAGLVTASDGKLYGTTVSGGSNSDGTVFSLLAYALLSIDKSGMGMVSGGEEHIYCGTACSCTYDIGTQVTLSALPSPGYTFTGWSGCDNMNGSYCSVTMTGAKNVTANFTVANVTLTSLTFKPSYVKGGQLSAGTVTLSGPAPQGGVTVALSSDHPGVAHPPSFVFVPGGKSSVQFGVQTFPVKSNTTVTITATAGSSHVSGTLMVGTTSLPQSVK